MPVAGGSGGSGGRGGKDKGKKDAPILTMPVSTGGGGGSSSGSSSSGGPTRNSGSKGGSKGGTGGRPNTTTSSSSSSSSSSYDYSAAQRQRDLAARDRYVEDARQLEGQIEALRAALGPNGEFRDALKKRLANIELVLGQQLDDLDKAEAARNANLDADAQNNRIAAGDSSARNDANRVRERASAITEAMMQGAGESDALRVQLMSLRNFDANQGEINRAFHDSARSIDSARIDLALDTHNARVNMVTEAQADKEQLWTTFYNQVSETQTQLGNALGQQAEYYGLARESARNAGGPGAKSRTSSSSSSSSSSKGGKPGGGKGGNGGKDRGGPVGGSNQPGGRNLPRTPLGRPKAGGSTPGFGLGAAQGQEVRYGDQVLNGGRLTGNGGARDLRVGPDGRGERYGKGLYGDQQRAGDASDRAFMAAAQSQGRAWKNPGLPKELRDWQPPAPTPEKLANSQFASARTTLAMKRPEGATLRKW